MLYSFCFAEFHTEESQFLKSQFFLYHMYLGKRSHALFK